MATTIEIYRCSELDTCTVHVHGDDADDWDILEDLTEQEAQDEAQAIADETGGTIYFT